jgi:hypothetical protein
LLAQRLDDFDRVFPHGTHYKTWNHQGSKITKVSQRFSW